MAGPKIAPHHRKDSWRPIQLWPENCTVQWGGRGVVLSREGSYRTAFFEAFPTDGSGGFIRGEGEDLEAAEADAYDRWRRQKGCHDTGGHRWTRARRLKAGGVRNFTNRGAFCLQCGAFQTVMKPIVRLGAWRGPLDYLELSMLMQGAARPRPNSDANDRRFKRRLELRARRAGIHLPDWRQPQYQEEEDEWPEEGTYDRACREAVLRYYVREYERLRQAPDNEGKSCMEAIFGHMAAKELHEEAVQMGLLSDPQSPATDTTPSP